MTEARAPQSPDAKAEPELALDFVPKLARKVRLRFDRHAEAHMLVYPERGLALNESAAAIAEKCDGTRDLATIVDELARATESDDEVRAIIETDVRAFVRDLRDKGLLEL